MKKIRNIVVIGLVTILIASTGIHVSAAEQSGLPAVTAVLDEVKEKISGAFAGLDSDTAQEVFSFVKQKIADGELTGDEGLKALVEESESKFGVSVSEEDARQLVATMEQLEELGFDSQYVIEKAEELYQEYGSDFIEHADEAITGAVKNVVENAVESFFKNLWESIKSFFASLFQGE